MTVTWPAYHAFRENIDLRGLVISPHFGFILTGEWKILVSHVCTTGYERNNYGVNVVRTETWLLKTVIFIRTRVPPHKALIISQPQGLYLLPLYALHLPSKILQGKCLIIHPIMINASSLPPLHTSRTRRMKHFSDISSRVIAERRYYW